MRVYDEQALVERLSRVDRRSKTAFAASCAQRLLPLFARYAESLGLSEQGARLADIVDAAWAVAANEPTARDLADLQAEAEAMVPTDEDAWILEMGYGQNAAAAGAYAVRTWLTDNPQEAGWAARQVYELADYAVLQGAPDLDLDSPHAATQVLASNVVQSALDGLARAIEVVESAPPAWQQLRADADADGRKMADSVP